MYKLREYVKRRDASEFPYVRRRILVLMRRYGHMLPKRIRFVLRHRWALKDENVWTLIEVGNALGISRTRVADLERRGINILEDTLKSRAPLIDQQKMSTWKHKEDWRDKTPTTIPYYSPKNN